MKSKIVPTFRIKICGITSVEDGRAAAAAGADAVGLNFYPQSPRCVSLETAQQIVQALPDSVIRVGVFVNADVDEMLAKQQRLGLHYLQLHGDEPAQLLTEFPVATVIRGLRAPAEDPYGVAEQYLEACQTCGVVPEALLLDASVPGQFGGTGHSLEWKLLFRRPRPLHSKMLILAGGLRPENVASAIEQARPDAVDTASGVESAPGKKDQQLMQRFVANARRAFATAYG